MDDRVTQREMEIRWEAHMREHDAQAVAVDKAAIALDVRLRGMNEFRDDLRSQAATFLPTARFDRFVDDNRDRVTAAVQSAKQENAAQASAVESRSIAINEALRRDVTLLDEKLDAVKELVRNRESMISVWRAIAGFVGVGGFVAVLYALGIGHR